mmetsp:Transcript_7323/g.11537  ORF Transcript_7323/g.11537 Transcript_7323/m.11537 type:complete len:143 (+) Transcript_7323:44-472(+)
MDYQPSYPATPRMAQDNRSLVCPSPPESRKSLIIFDGLSVVLPFQMQLSSKCDPSSVVNGPEREMVFSLKPMSSLTSTSTETDGEITKVAIESFPPPPFGYTQNQEVGGSLSNPSKLPSQVRQRPLAQAQARQRHTLSARCA